MNDNIKIKVYVHERHLFYFIELMKLADGLSIESSYKHSKSIDFTITMVNTVDSYIEFIIPVNLYLKLMIFSK